MNRTRILIIEDNKDLREDIVDTLKMEGFESAGADNGSSGIALIRSFKPDIIVCDITMPELDGYGVLEYVRETPETMLLPFIFLTAHSDREHMRKGMVHGADDYVTKPFENIELLQSIHRQIKKRTNVHVHVENRLEELRENIITALPHELRTPLNTILGFSEMMMLEAERLDPQDMTNWAGHIHAAAQRLYHLVENYLFYVRLQLALQFADRRQEFLDARLNDAKNLIETQAIKIVRRAGRKADLLLQVAEAPQLRFSNSDMVKVISELLDNALKFSNFDTPIRVIGEVADNSYVLYVEDEGRGISPEQIDHIGAYMQFERSFYEQQGLGLGLAIVQQMVELYGGRFEINSAVGKGTRVCLHLAIN